MVRCKVCGEAMEFAPKRIVKGEAPFALLALMSALDFSGSVNRFICPTGHCIAWVVPILEGGHGQVDVVETVSAN